MDTAEYMMQRHFSCRTEVEKVGQRVCKSMPRSRECKLASRECSVRTQAICGLVKCRVALLAYKFVASSACASADSVGTDTFAATNGTVSAADSASGSGSSMAAAAREADTCSSLARLGARSSSAPSSARLPWWRLLFDFGSDMPSAIEQTVGGNVVKRSDECAAESSRALCVRMRNRESGAAEGGNGGHF